MLRATFGIVVAGVALAGAAADVQGQPQGGPGRRVFETRCAVCHGNDGHGGDTGPSIVYRLPLLREAEIVALLQGGRPARGMPPQPMPAVKRPSLIRYLRAIERREPPLTRATIQTTDGRTLDGVVLNQGFSDLQLRTDDKKVHLLRRSGAQFRPVAAETGWPTYNGDPGGNRYTTLTHIEKTNVGRLAPAWLFSVPDAGNLQVTPA